MADNDSAWLQLELQISSGAVDSFSQMVDCLEALPPDLPGPRYSKRLKVCLEALMSADRPMTALAMLTSLAHASKGSYEWLAESILWLCRQLMSRGSIGECRALVTQLQQQDVDIEELLEALWKGAESEVELLAMLETFELGGLFDKDIANRLYFALLNHGSSDLMISELYGVRARFWTSTIVRGWIAAEKPRSVLNDFWRLQGLVGERPLASLLYETVLRIATRAELPAEKAQIENYHKFVTKKSSNTNVISDIVHESKRSDWDAVRASLNNLQIEGFVTMPVQSRMQLFDPVVQRFASSNQSTEDIFEFGQAICSRISVSATPPRTLQLMSMSLLRCGRMDIVVKLHDHVAVMLDRELRLTSVDVLNLLRSYYYAFRPPTVLLGHMMRKLFQGSWSTISRFCLPLLQIAASYDAKWNQSKRMLDLSRPLVKTAVSRLDDIHFRDEIFRLTYYEKALNGTDMNASLAESDARVRATPLSYELVSESTSDSCEPDFTTLDLVDPDAESTGTDQAEYMMPDDITEFEADESGSSNGTTTFEAEKVVSSNNMTKSESENLESEENVSRTCSVPVPQLPSHSDGYYSHSMAKSLIHDAISYGGYGDAVEALGTLASENLHSPSANLISLVTDSAASLSPELAAAIRDQAELTGSDTSLARLTELIASISSPEVDGAGLSTPEVLSELKEIVTSEYQRLSDSDHAVNHALPTAIANKLLGADQPTEAIELLRHALELPHVASPFPGPAPMLALLKAYTRLGHTDGIRWVIGSMLANDGRMDKSFITALKWGRSYWILNKKVSMSLRNKLVDTLDLMRRLCLSKKEQQIKRTWDVGNEMVEFILERAKQPRWEESEKTLENEDWVDALIVETLCRDLAYSAKRARYRSASPFVGAVRQLRILKANEEVKARQRLAN
ncbi:hypothetical protein CAC42_7652 [Sphaceloma murrayae]|uniref:Uncharacterized protein n=1 Tax=Sphaceloma murrayae TaxID=2082308 RepID=A0A2K1QTS8_9PEZI|nr:hypothetical protein CAC42_7652 [Sphaceloma murrayae]